LDQSITAFVVRGRRARETGFDQPRLNLGSRDHSAGLVHDATGNRDGIEILCVNVLKVESEQKDSEKRET
jgi:hypothetical protein